MKTPIGREIILIAEDDKMVRSMMKSVLSLHGYQVVAAQDGAEAIRLFKRNRSAISLVVLDHEMPGMCGPEVIDSIHSSGAKTPVILTSGYRLNTKDLSYSQDGKVAYVNKPYPLELMIDLVHEMIEEH